MLIFSLEENTLRTVPTLSVISVFVIVTLPADAFGGIKNEK